MFNSLRLSVVVTAEVLTDVLADITAEAVASRLGYCFGGLNTN